MMRMNLMKIIEEREQDIQVCSYADHCHGNPMQAVQLAYLAGLFDGEGTVRIDKMKSYKSLAILNRVNPFYAAHLSIGSVDEIVITMFYEFFNVGHKGVERVHGNRQTVYRWQVRGNPSSKSVLEQLLPYLVLKKQRAEVVLKFIEDWKTPYARGKQVEPQELLRREDAYQAMRKLNLVGAAATTERKGTREGETTV